MKIVKNNLEQIADFWNSYVLEFKLIQNQIRWDSEVKTNYFGDILNYFTDTFELIKRKPLKNNFQDSIFYATGLLQIIYTHQDLTDELLHIFKLNSSSISDKNPNREIRNELIGHPVSREKPENSRKLRSTVFWGKGLSEDNLHYIIYSIDTNFEGVDKSFEIQTIIDNHVAFLNKYFGIILQKIRKILKTYSKQITELLTVLDKELDFEKILEFTSQRYELIFKQNYLFNIKDLKESYRRKLEHERYQNVINIFLKRLREYLIDTQSNIKRFLSVEKVESIQNKIIESPKINLVFVKSFENSEVNNSKKRNFDYELSKLFSKKHPLINVNYFKRLIKDNDEITQELDNMEINFENNLEYYSSFEYLKLLIDQNLKAQN
jgi:hypothetical protein